MSINLIIFDLDGTLIDAFDPLVESLNFAMRELGYPPQDPEFIKRSVGWGERKLLLKFVTEAELARVTDVYRQHHQDTLRRGVKFMPGANELLERLYSSGYPLAVATNRPAWSTSVILEALNMNRFFRKVFSGDTVKNPKPAPDMVQQILMELNIPPDAAIFVGDMVLDIETGNRAGVKSIGITTGTMTREELEAVPAYQVVDHISKIWDIVRELNGRCACSNRCFGDGRL